MSYEPKVWECGEIVTADALNNIEDGVQEALGCCDRLPVATSEDEGKVLGVDANGDYELIDASVDIGYECIDSYDTLFSGSVNRGNNDLSYSTPITADPLLVILNGIEYQVSPNIVSGGAVYEYGNASSTGEYPFYINSNPGGNVFVYFPRSADDPITVTLILGIPMSSVETSECFEKAVESVVGNGLKNLVDGDAVGSVRGIYTTEESGSYSVGNYAMAVGLRTKASNDASFAEGVDTTASGGYSHAEGNFSTASNTCSHAEGYYTQATASNSHAEGSNTTASQTSAHAEGNYTTASGNASHAEGNYTTASGSFAHAEGDNAVASGNRSHAEGFHTTAKNLSQHVFGEYNQLDPSSASVSNRGTYVEIVGNGTGTGARSNARTLDWSGNESLQGSLTLGKGTVDETTITATQLKALLALLN